MVKIVALLCSFGLGVCFSLLGAISVKLMPRLQDRSGEVRQPGDGLHERLPGRLAADGRDYRSAGLQAGGRFRLRHGGGVHFPVGAEQVVRGRVRLVPAVRIRRDGPEHGRQHADSPGVIRRARRFEGPQLGERGLRRGPSVGPADRELPVPHGVLREHGFCFGRDHWLAGGVGHLGHLSSAERGCLRVRQRPVDARQTGGGGGLSGPVLLLRFGRLVQQLAAGVWEGSDWRVPSQRRRRCGRRVGSAADLGVRGGDYARAADCQPGAGAEGVWRLVFGGRVAGCSPVGRVDDLDAARPGGMAVGVRGGTHHRTFLPPDRGEHLWQVQRHRKFTAACSASSLPGPCWAARPCPRRSAIWPADRAFKRA